MARFLIIAFYEVFPPASGAAVVSYNCARFLKGEKFLLQLSRSRCEMLPEDGIKLINIDVPQDRNAKKVPGLAWRLPDIVNRIKAVDPDCLILEGSSWSVYHLALLSFVRAARVKSKIVYHAHNVEYVLRRQKSNFLVAWLTKWAEGHLLKKTDLNTAVSEIDAQSFERLYGTRPILLPNGVDLERFQAVTPEDVAAVRKRYHLTGQIVLFMGLASYKPNREAIDFLIGRVFPGLISHLPEARLAVIGGQVGCEKDWLIAPGNIPFRDIPAFIAACDVCVAPIFSGSGTRLKILEYLAAAKSVVATAKGAEGIRVEAGKNIVMAEAEAFGEEVELLLRDPGRAAKIGAAGFRVVEEHYSWQRIMADFQGRLTMRRG
jgi:glycosyltransferase involved in cell wall biosynthesis